MDRGAIAEGVAILEAVLPIAKPGPYQLQAAIAAVHDEPPTSTRPTGRRSSRCTTFSPPSRLGRWSRSTGLSPSRWCVARPRVIASA